MLYNAKAVSSWSRRTSMALESGGEAYFASVRRFYEISIRIEKRIVSRFNSIRIIINIRRMENFTYANELLECNPRIFLYLNSSVNL